MPIASHQYTVKTAKCFYATETQEQQRSQNRKFWNRIKLKIYIKVKASFRYIYV